MLVSLGAHACSKESENERNPGTMITSHDLIELIARSAIEVDAATLRDDLDLYGQGLDSLDVANLELQIEQHYGIEFGPEQTLRLRTIRDFVDFLNSDANITDKEANNTKFSQRGS